MKNLLKCLAVLVLATLGLIAGGRTDSAADLAPGEAKVTVAGDQAVISWNEVLADPKAEPTEVPFSLLTGPYIASLGSDTAAIGWEVVAEKKLTQSPYASLSGDYNLKKMQFRSATLTNLKPDTAYRYRLTASNGKYRYTGKEYRFRTLPPPRSKKIRFAVIGDTQRFASKPYTNINKQLYADIMAWNPPLVLHVGDIVYTGWGPGINGRKQWFRVFNLMRDLRATRWLAPAMGNHDVQVGKMNWGPDYFQDLAVQKNNKAGKAQPPFYYSFDVGNVHFAALSTEQRRLGPKKKDLSDTKVYGRFTWKDQLDWLKEDLRQCRSPWKIVYFHRPMHTVGGYPCAADFREDFGKLFDQYKVSVIFSGHDHSYQRTVRINNTTRKRSDTGTVQVVSGGASNQFGRKSKPPWNVLHVKLYHYLRVEVDDNEMRVDCITHEGKRFESWRMKQVGQPETLKAPQP